MTSESYWNCIGPTDHLKDCGTSPFLCHIVTTVGKTSVCRLFSFNVKVSRSCFSFPRHLLGHGCVTQPSPHLAQDPCTTVWWVKAVWLGEWDWTCMWCIQTSNRVCFLCLFPGGGLADVWGGLGYNLSADSLKLWQWTPVLRVTSANFLLSLTGTKIH